MNDGGSNLARSHTTLVVDGDAREVVFGGRAITLTRVEFDLLEELWKAPNRVLSHSYLSGVISGSSWVGDGHGLEVHICRLRRKLGESGSAPSLIRTVRGVGYKFVPPVTAPSAVEPEAWSAQLDPRDFLARWRAESRRPGAQLMVRDGAMIVLSLETQSDTFLGWRHGQVLKRFLSISVNPTIHSDQTVAIRVAESFALAGLTHTEGTELVRCAHGNMWMHVLRHIWLDSRGSLGGIETIHIPLPPPRSIDLI